PRPICGVGLAAPDGQRPPALLRLGQLAAVPDRSSGRVPGRGDGPELCRCGDHAAIYLECCVVRWLMELVGFPTAGSMGLLVSRESMASLTCLAAARQWAVAAM